MFETFTGKEYIKIDVASSYGHDKLPWRERIEWFDANEAELIFACDYQDQLGEGDESHPLLRDADKPALVYQGVRSWQQALAGLPSGRPISLDATASGLQLLSAMAGCRVGAEACNVVDVGRRVDAYTEAFETMKAMVGTSAVIERKQTKQAVMTAFYGSKAIPKEVFGEGELLRAFYDTVKARFPGAWDVTVAFAGDPQAFERTAPPLWDPETLAHEWVLPDGFKVVDKVEHDVTDLFHFMDEPHEITRTENAPNKSGVKLAANSVHSVDGFVVREMVRRCSHDADRVAYIRRFVTAGAHGQGGINSPDGLMVARLNDLHAQSGFLSARILDHLEPDNVGLLSDAAREDLYVLLFSLPEKPFRVLTVHDCFRCLPNYGNDLRRQYNRILADVCRSHILSFIASQIGNRPITVNKLDPELYHDILEANYSLS